MILESLHIIVDGDDGTPGIGSLSVRASHSQNLRTPDSLGKFQDYQWSDEVGVRETLSVLAYSLGFELAKRLAYRVQE